MADVRVTQTPIEVAVAVSPTIRTTQTAVEAAVSVASSIRATQAVIEVAVLAGPQVRTTQVVVEVAAPLVGPVFTQVVVEAAVVDLRLYVTTARVSQQNVEFLGTTSGTTRVSSLAVELVDGHSAPARASQLAVEVIAGESGRLRVSQLVVEILHTTVPVAVGAARQRRIRRLRRSPHLAGEDLRTYYDLLMLSVESGMGLTEGQGEDPQIMLRWSDDGGRTWSDEVWTSIGRQGQFAWQALWRRLGSSRNRVFEVTVSDPVKWVIVDAELGARLGGN